MDTKKVTFNPIQTDNVLNNPFMGFVADARYIPDTEQPVYRLAHANITWKDLEPEQGEYAFEQVEKDNHFEEWDARDVKLVIRVMLDRPSEIPHMDIPKWVYEATNQQGTEYDIEWGKGFSPDYLNPTLITLHQELIKKLADRYNDDSRIAYVELGSLGHWGEWHTINDDMVTIPFPKINIADQYVQHYINVFTNKHLMMRRPYPLAKQSNMGLFNDAFGNKESTVDEFDQWVNKGYTFWLTDEPMPAMPNYWANAPAGGEFSSAETPEFYFKDEHIEETLNQIKLTHPSWLGPYALNDVPMDGEIQRNVDRFMRTIGYRFSLLSETHQERVKPGRKLHVDMDWANTGVAPFYETWPLELSLVDEDGNLVTQQLTKEDIRTWQPGNKKTRQTLLVPKDLVAGNYTLCVAILDPDTQLPGIEFAMDGKRSDGRYTLGTMVVE
ncbi:DUF4832 domain-containing protein [Paenibacillus antarcticus]|uniref:DUF4832 domain-containing protein n=1 Tax=Paenibacillus antarcticus TaxID=253703 RepID=A0A168Q0M3_9BACL|nr:DUF4832 domain-containing protein [Paenibacillus antarcticus]OAB47260.1 hypothetical protein PBAT_06005 [Paenibacillus antarcticus]